MNQYNFDDKSRKQHLESKMQLEQLKVEQEKKHLSRLKKLKTTIANLFRKNKDQEDISKIQQTIKDI